MADTAALVRAIIDRRRTHDDPDRHLLGDDDRDALACVRYVRSHRRVPATVLRDDVADALAITEQLRTEVDAHQLGLLRMARRPGPARLTWQRIAGSLGMTSRQGPIDRLRRLEAADQGATDIEARRDRTLHRRRTAWLAARGRAAAVFELAGGWVRIREDIPEAWAEDVDELVELRDPLALAVAVLALTRELRAAGADHGPAAEIITRSAAALTGFPGQRGE